MTNTDLVQVVCPCGRALGRFEAYGDSHDGDCGIYMECPKCRKLVHIVVADLIEAAEQGTGKIVAAPAEME